MENICKNCVFYKSEHLYKYGECSKVLDSPSFEDIGLKLNPNRDVNNKDDYKKPSHVPDINSDIVLDRIIFHNGGHYDAISVGEYFSCIHFNVDDHSEQP